MLWYHKTTKLHSVMRVFVVLINWLIKVSLCECFGGRLFVREHITTNLMSSLHETEVFSGEIRKYDAIHIRWEVICVVEGNRRCLLFPDGAPLMLGCYSSYSITQQHWSLIIHFFFSNLIITFIIQSHSWNSKNEWKRPYASTAGSDHRSQA